MFISLILPLKNLMMSVKSILLSKMISLEDKRNKRLICYQSRQVKRPKEDHHVEFVETNSIDGLHLLSRDSNDKVQVAKLNGTNTGTLY